MPELVICARNAPEQRRRMINGGSGGNNNHYQSGKTGSTFKPTKTLKTSCSQSTITFTHVPGFKFKRRCLSAILCFGRVAGTKVIGFSQKNFSGDPTPLPQSARRGRKWPFLGRLFDDPPTTTTTTTTFLQTFKLLDASTDLHETWTGYRGG